MSDAARLAVVLFALQQIDQIHRGVEAHAFVMRRDPGHSQGGGEVCFACSRPADEYDILRGIGELQVGQIPDQAGICAGSAEVEAGQITMHGEFGHVHLVVH
ncbi:hypothetical protein D3C81_1557270 [compost metagenome]